MLRLANGATKEQTARSPRMILSVPEKRTESFRNRTSAMWDCPHVAGIHTLRTSFEPYHCQFYTHNGDSWRIRLNIETYLLLLLSPSFLPISLFLYHPLPPPRGLDIITKIFKGRRVYENESLAALSRRTESRNERISARFLLRMDERGDVKPDSHRGQAFP